MKVDTSLISYMSYFTMIYVSKYLYHVATLANRQREEE